MVEERRDVVADGARADSAAAPQDTIKVGIAVRHPICPGGLKAIGSQVNVHLLPARNLGEFTIDGLLVASKLVAMFAAVHFILDCDDKEWTARNDKQINVVRLTPNLHLAQFHAI